jgi:hypothetical protein
MTIKYASLTVNIHGLDTDINSIEFLKGWIREAAFACLGGRAKDHFNWRNEFESDLEVIIEETAGEDPGYIAPVCKNCDHWYQTGTCSNPKFKYEFTKGDEQPESDGIMIEYDEGWGAVCGPEFGCIHYTERT